MTLRVDRCPTCGCTGPVDSHHLARRDNDPEFTADACKPDHYKFLTSYHETSGITPGIEPVHARMGGVAQYLTLMYQRHGYDQTAESFRVLDSAISSVHGRHTLKWARPRLIADLNADMPDPVVLIADTSRLLCDLFVRTSEDTAVPGQSVPLLDIAVRFFRAVSEHPAAYRKFTETYDYTEMREFIRYMGKVCESVDKSAGYRWDGITVELQRGFQRVMIPEAVSFLRTLSQKVRAEVPV